MAGIFFLSLAHGAKNPDYCWFPSPCTSYQEWMNAGKTAKSSKQKICCYSKAISLAGNNNEKKAEAYFQRGYAKYYYLLDVTGETWEASSPGKEGQIIDEGGGKSIEEEALVPRDKRRDEGYADYVEALKLAPNHSDSYFECGVYWYWKAYREEAKGPANKTTASIYYNKALTCITQCIQRDKWCTTAYEIRSRIREKLGPLSGKTRDLELRDKLRLHDDAVTGSGLTGYYCNGRDFTGLVAVRKDSRVDFNWGGGNSGTGTGKDNFCIRWIGTINPPSDGSYTFSTYSDDGVRLWIDNKKIIDNWTDHSGTWDYSNSLSLKKDRPIQVVLEFYENDGSACISLYWKPPGGSHQAIPTQYLYPVPSPEAAQFPLFFQHGIGNYTGWNLTLDKGTYSLCTGDYNDNLSSVFVPELYSVTIYEHGESSGRSASFSGLCSKDLSSISMGDGTFNDEVSTVKVQCKSGFGE